MRIDPTWARLAPLVLVAVAACEGRRETASLPEGEARLNRPTPDALMVRFEKVQGTGFSRESWELEVLQMGTDVRLRGSVRTGGSSVPIFGAMGPGEYQEFWLWLRGLPFDGARLVEKADAPQTDWRKTLDIDVVNGVDVRLQSTNRWTRPLVGGAWVDDVEQRLYTLALDLAEAELDRLQAETDGGIDPDLDDSMRHALEALGDAETTNVSGGSPDAD